MVTSNFLNNVAGYVNTGTWSEKAIAEAKYYGNVVEVASSKTKIILIYQMILKF